MCGRYLRRSSKQGITEAFELPRDPTHISLSPSDYNIAPTTHQPVIRNNRNTGERELVLMRWGMVPQFANSISEFNGISTINARADALAEKPMWRIPFETRRCLVPADGFYEWKPRLSMTESSSRRTKQPYAFTMADPAAAPFAFAGIWSAWKDPATNDWLQSFAIITTEANELMAPIHNRMPVILQPEDYDRWLNRERKSLTSTSDLPLDLLRPYSSQALQTIPCNPIEAQAASSL